MDKLFHARKGILTPAGKNFSPLKGMQDIYADEKGKKHTLDGTEVPVEHILKAHEENNAKKEDSKKEQEKMSAEEDKNEIENISGIMDKKTAIAEKEQKHKDILSEIKSSSEAIVGAVEAIPETVIPEFPDHYKEQSVWQEKVLEALKLEFPETDMKPVVEAIKGIKFPEFPTPLNYTSILESIKKALPKERDNSDIILAIQSIPTPIFEQPPFKFNKNGSLKVAVDEMAVSTGGGSSVDISSLATEETLQALVASGGSSYEQSDFDIASDPMYLGYVDKDGAWYIKQVDTSSGADRYCKGSTDYPTNWTGRTTLTYDLYNNIF